MAHDEAAIAAAIERLREGERLGRAEANVAAAAPALQMVLAEALASGGWFGDSHQAEVERVAADRGRLGASRGDLDAAG